MCVFQRLFAYANVAILAHEHTAGNARKEELNITIIEQEVRNIMAQYIDQVGGYIADAPN